MDTVNKFGNYCMYLRRSRADDDADRMGAGETLARHYMMLQELAGRMLGHPIPESAVYREIVSGDTIADRPEMRRLMQDVELGRWNGVFVADIDRLARGDTMDQGLVAQTFLYSQTLIVTPLKVYDPEDPADNEFFEIRLFFARREYQMIKRRMQTGRVNAVKEGYYVSSRPIYGYERYKLPDRRGWSLKIVEDQAAVVRKIYDWYLHGENGETLGCQRIANRLNSMGVKTLQGLPWQSDRVLNVLKNPTYKGCVQWYQRREQVHMQDGQKVKKRPLSDDHIVVPGYHEAIIDEALFDRAQELIVDRRNAPIPGKRKCVNPLTGLIRCGHCGYAVRMSNAGRGLDGAYLKCTYINTCTSFGIRFRPVEQVVLNTLQSWVDYDVSRLPEEQKQQTENNDALRAAQEKQIATLNKQLSRLRDLLEQGVYTVDVYLERERDLRARIEACQNALEQLRPKEKPMEQVLAEFAPLVKNVLEAYAATDDPAEKNALLKTVIDHIVYFKTAKTLRGHSPLESLTLEIYPRLPK